MSSFQNRSNTPKVGRNAQTGEFVVGLKASKHISRIEGLVAPKEMQRTFEEFESKKTQASERLAILKKRYGYSKG